MELRAMRSHAATRLSDLPGLRLPWPARHNPHAEAHARAARQRAAGLGLLPTAQDGRRFDAFIVADGWAYPTAAPDRLWAAGGFNQWLYFLDDQYDDNPEFGRDPDAVQRLLGRAYSIFESGMLPTNPTAFDHFSLDVRNALMAFAPADWRSRFLADLRGYLFDGSLAVMQLWAANRTLPIDDYTRLRLFDSSLFAVFDVLEIGVEGTVSPAIRMQAPFQEARIRAARHVAFANDVYSYHKEVIRNGSRFNLLAVLETAHQLTLDQALAEASALLALDVEHFVAAEAALPTDDAALARYLDGLKGWMTGNVAFSAISPRFRDAETPFAELRPEQKPAEQRLSESGAR